MNPHTRTRTRTRTRIARTSAFAVAASITAGTRPVVAPRTTASAPDPERPCFIVQPRWNTAIDGPAPTCPTPAWQQAAAARIGTPGSSVRTAPRRTAPVEEPEVATIADCVDTSYRPVVKTCPYPIKSGDQFSQYADRTQVSRSGVGRVRFDDVYGEPAR